MRNACHAVALRHQRWPARGQQHSSRIGHDASRLAIGSFQEMHVSHWLAGGHFRAQGQQGLVDTRLGGKSIIVPAQGLHPARGRKALLGAGDLLALDQARLDENVTQTVLRDAVHLGRDRLTSAHLGGNHGFALPFGFDRQQARAGDVGIEKREVGIPGQSALDHPPPLLAVFDQVHVAQG